MQVATLFRETAKLLGASMDGSSAMDNNKYCMKSENQADDGYETCVDAVCGNNMERMLGGMVPPHLDPNMRHLGLDGHSHPQHPHHQLHHNHHGRQSMPGMKMEQYGDPYSFVDEMPNACMPHPMGANLVSQVKKRGRRKKPDLKNEEYGEIKKPLREEVSMDPKERKRHDRFNGLSEAEVSRRTLPDHLTSNLDIVIVGINPGLFAAFKGHHYAGPGNHFWKCLYMSGLVPEPLTADDDYSLLHYGIGFTNMVARPTKGSADLTRREIKQGSQILLEKLQKYQPKVAVFNGKLIYEVFSGKKDFPFGRQSEFVEGTNTYIWVMPSSSARCAQLPRAADKVPFYSALKKFRDYLNGLISELDDSEVVFNDSKPVAKASNAEPKHLLDSATRLSEEDPAVLLDGNVTAKKKRGRPRKGMEKQPPNPKKAKVAKKDSRGSELDLQEPGQMDHYGKSMDDMDNSNKASRLLDAQRKRRGRPKKAKVVDGSPPSCSMGNKTPPDTLESSTQNSIGTCQTQAASSVSSGYSTGTNGSEERRREENGSLSNAGSGGPSPSHHSFTTQSDLSSEISAAISCGSPQQSPLNGQPESLFDPMVGVAHSRMDSLGQNSKMSSGSHNAHHQNSSNFRPTGNIFNPQSLGSSLESHNDGLYSHHPYYDNRLHNLSNRSQTYQPSNSRDGNNDGSMQTGPPPPAYQSQYENKALDVAAKSLSGLESLVDQIPSIAEAEIPAVSSGGCLSGLLPDSISQSMSHLGSVPSSMSHSGHYSESSSGFLPYSHGPPSSYAAASHYATSPYYASEINPTFPVNSLGPTYCSPSASSGIMFGYPGYHSQYSSGASGYPHSSSAGLHLAPPAYGTPPGYPPPPYPNPSHYAAHGHPMSSSNGSGSQRFTPQRLHLRQDGMDLGHMGFSGF